MSVTYVDTDFVAVRSNVSALVDYLDTVTEPVKILGWTKANPPRAAAAESPSVLPLLLELMRDLARVNSVPIKREVLRFSIDMLTGVMTPSTIAPSIIPTARGGVRIAWIAQNAELQVEIAAPPTVSIRHRDPMGERIWSADTDYSELLRLIKTEFTPRLPPTLPETIQALVPKTEWELRHQEVGRQAITQAAYFAGASLPTVQMPTVMLSDEGIVGLQWRNDRCGVLLLFAGDHKASYSVRDETHDYASNETEFLLTEGPPLELLDAIRNARRP
jgi:hypothetical protein